ncbi:MAG: hypothetical protein LQ338_007803 [Usnochroma carphineum]|nr:MAG: hypothetical protein LQ338_007803 [Usnochroma carphineum]
MPMYETNWRVSLSDWGRRLWTFEELVVSGHVLLNCSDGLLELVPGEQLVEAPDSQYKYNPSDLIGLPSLVAFHTRFPNTLPTLSLVSSLMNHACQLTISRWEDETLCLASILNMETAPLAALAPDDRMETLLREIQCFPARILFGNGPRLKKPGLGWAPTTFLKDHGCPASPEDRPGRYLVEPDVHGFVTTLGGYELVDCAVQIRRFAVLRVLEPGAPLLTMDYLAEHPDPRAEWYEMLHEVHTRDTPEPNIDFLPQVFHPPLKLILLGTNLLGPAILVHSVNHVGGTEVVEFLARFSVELFVDTARMRDGFSVEQLDWRKGEIVHARPIHEQRWVIT